jgi:hypothetical protein
MAVIGGPHPHQLPKLDGSLLVDKRVVGGGALPLPTSPGSRKSPIGHKKSRVRTFRRSSLQFDSTVVYPSPFERR